MTNEWLEFKAYTDKPTYFSSGKRDFSYLGRFSLNTILELEGMGRILTIIARGYLFHDKDGNILNTAKCDYPRWKAGLYCNASLSIFRQHPLDYLESLEQVIKMVKEKKGPFDREVVLKYYEQYKSCNSKLNKIKGGK